MSFQPSPLFPPSDPPHVSQSAPSGLLSILGGFFICTAVCYNLRVALRSQSANKLGHSLLNLDLYSKWQLSTIAGFLLTPSLVCFLSQSKNLNTQLFEQPADFFSGLNFVSMIISGFLLGAGAKLTGGGLDTYGFYGLVRCSKRSILTVATILGMGGLTNLLRNTYMSAGDTSLLDFSVNIDSRIALNVPVLLLTFDIIKNKARLINTLKTFFAGCLLAVGLIISGMAYRSKMLGFLSYDYSWDPFLLYVIVGAITSSFIMFKLLLKNHNFTREKWLSSKLDARLVIGSLLYGIGLGITGMTPGTGLLLVPVYLPQIIICFLPSLALGNVIAEPIVNSILPPIRI